MIIFSELHFRCVLPGFLTMVGHFMFSLVCCPPGGMSSSRSQYMLPEDDIPPGGISHTQIPHLYVHLNVCGLALSLATHKNNTSIGSKANHLMRFLL